DRGGERLRVDKDTSYRVAADDEVESAVAVDVVSNQDAVLVGRLGDLTPGEEPVGDMFEPDGRRASDVYDVEVPVAIKVASSHTGNRLTASSNEVNRFEGAAGTLPEQRDPRARI